MRAVISPPRSTVTVQRQFRTVVRRDPPTLMSIYKCYRQTDQTGCICIGKCPHRRPVADAPVDQVRESFLRSPRRSTSQAVCSTFQEATHREHKILQERFELKSYGSQLLQHVTAQDTEVRLHFAGTFSFKTSR